MKFKLSAEDIGFIIILVLLIAMAILLMFGK
jgi:hypothetical protein